MIRGLSKEHEKLIFDTIKFFFPKAQIIVFGSRIAGNHKPFSDIDISLKDTHPLALAKWSQMEEVFAESDLTVMVDLSDFHLLTEDFQKHVLSTGRVLP